MSLIEPCTPIFFHQSAHVRAIQSRIDEIRKEIRREMKRPAPDVFRLSQLKRKKLHLKDKVRRLINAQIARAGGPKRPGSRVQKNGLQK
ncbi:hypothetical protein HY29_03820 [Hyphomonas beringensis]|uniref:DUF465 domain-containing protein n=1 Tax=Hyphomonas beringensis TaxID=1280946 RepID=A0A062U9T2_9PROT|nr:DUF465 domain-containing protein [Hyphomonas beringensis]KCZ53359.1 hypothetical protein HY29_03820 [Hyphomonas beringensis]